MHKNVLFVLLGMVVACAAGAGTRIATGQPFAPSATAHRWQQFCMPTDPGNVSDAARAYGADGWELAAVTGVGTVNRGLSERGEGRRARAIFAPLLRKRR